MPDRGRMRVTVRGNRLVSLGARITVDVPEGPTPEVRIHAPFCRRAIPVSEISDITSASDDGMNHGLLNWFVTGRASAPGGVRINNGGRARVTIRTRDGSLFNVVVDDHDQASRRVEDVRSIRARSSG